MIYYLFTYNNNLPGVNAKIIAKIEALNKLGVSIRGIALYTDKELDLNLVSNDFIEGYFYNPPKNNNRILQSRFFGLINSFLIKRRGGRYLYNEVLSDKKIELLVTRYGTSDFNSLWLVKKLDGKILYESNTNEIEQLKLRFKGFFKSPLWVSYDYYSEKYFGPKVLRKVKGVICVTNEIANYQKLRIGKNYKTKVAVISNGIKVANYPLTSPNLAQTINFVMLLGVDSPWNGLDIIVDSIFKSDLDIKLYVVGGVAKNYESPKIIYSGILNKKEIDDLIINKRIVCGVGTLALYRKGITEACPLKVREYLARGLPVIYNYYDTDIDAHPNFRDKYCIKLKKEAEALNLDEIIQKLEKIQSVDNYHLDIQNFAKENIDMKVKMSAYSEFITSF